MNIAIHLLIAYFCIAFPFIIFIIYNIMRFFSDVFFGTVYNNGVFDIILNPWFVGVIWWIGVTLLLKTKIGAFWPVILLIGILVFGMAFIVYGQIIPRLMSIILPCFP